MSTRDPNEAGRQLPRPLALGGVPDVEGACRTVLDCTLIGWGSRLSETEYEDCVAYLVAESWVCHRRYDPARGASFRTYLYADIRRRVVDWHRSTFGRSGSSRPSIVGLGDLDERQLEAALARSGADAEGDRDPDLERLLADGDRPGSRRSAARGARAALRSSGRARSAAR